LLIEVEVVMSGKGIPAGKVFLLIEDMQNLREKMIEDLQTFVEGATYLEAEDLEEAYEFCDKEDIDVIISDWNLPDGIGYDLLLKVKAEDKFKDTPFLMCSTMDNIEDIMKTIAAGADEYIVKPWCIEELEEKVLSSWNAHSS
jgi:two-component system chemotaxis response regulator CheY